MSLSLKLLNRALALAEDVLYKYSLTLFLCVYTCFWLWKAVKQTYQTQCLTNGRQKLECFCSVCFNISSVTQWLFLTPGHEM